jgi:hypothetical protein
MADNQDCQDEKEFNGEISAEEEADDLKCRANELFKGILQIEP